MSCLSHIVDMVGDLCRTGFAGGLGLGEGSLEWSGLSGEALGSLTATTSCHRPSMSGLDLAKRSHRKMDLQRDFSVASPAEFVTRFGGNRVIEKVCPHMLLLVPG